METILTQVFNGISLGSIMLLIALGLAITFGLMNVINMAHGELIMIGAYMTYLTQIVFSQFLPKSLFGVYFIVAIPIAFIVAAIMGLLLERFLIRYLYGRPLDSLLATWGISL
ncbi:urea ABC transporter permease subunit UrtB, partial [Cutibacterium acnes]